ncbi:MAG: toxin-antitoxin system HicB family antitoxin [candidate division Zixibacteria bacterium]|nr:toxin-antitoxin system HicB family antitoxin [candidate division Zixibacteria bacterium]
MSDKKKDLNYYLGLDYDLIIRKITSEDGSFYQVTTRELSPAAFYGTGDAIEGAIRSFEETKKVLFKHHLERGIEIPEPEREEDSDYSGKFVVRTSPALHCRLVKIAKKNRQSLNSYVNAVLERTTTADDIMEATKQALCATFHLHTERYLRSIYTFEEGRHSPALGQKEVNAA